MTHVDVDAELARIRQARRKSDDAAAEWARVYGAPSAGQSGLLGAITARAEAQVIRLAIVPVGWSALQDRSTRPPILLGHWRPKGGET